MTELRIDSYFDKVFYINLDRDKDRNDSMILQFEKWGIGNYERVEGVTYDIVPERVLWRNFIKSDEKYIKGQLGCRDSQLKAVKLAKERDYKRVLILEDDVIFTVDPNTLLNLNSGILEDWNMLYFGGLQEHMYRNQIVCAHAYGVNSRIYDDIINMMIPSGMEGDNFYAKIIQHMSYNYNQSGKYNIRKIEPFNTVTQDQNKFKSNIQ
jgi:GR25 family glycosyltransferase involved in LPS biosynthesis